jgi:16S rRNA (cytidine1402-2'-O)-methyltransferase
MRNPYDKTDEAGERLPGPVLYVIGTPIGNLEDITLRALRVLRGVDLIACEDTRQTHKLLQHYGIRRRTISYHKHNEMTRAAELILQLEQGISLGLVTDAGMPSISDPGARLISLAIRHHFRVVPVPGASAFLAALVASGLSSDSFRFNAFLPARRGPRREALELARNSPRTQIFYEAPHRIIDALEDIVAVMGPERHVVIAREVTKLHEEFLRGCAADLLDVLRERGELKGEITLLIDKPDHQPRPAQPTPPGIRQRVAEVMAGEKLDQMAALKIVAREFGISKSAAYRELQRGK